MHNCKYCDRELKSKAGQIRHESSCKARDIGGQTEEEIADVIADVAEEIVCAGLDTDNAGELIVVEDEVVQLEVMGGAETYYDGHPRRATKLKGLLSRTFDKRERHKIRQLIMKVENETYKG